MATERTSALASRGLETSSEPSIPTSPRSITTSPSVTAGERPSAPPPAPATTPETGWRRGLRRFPASLTLKLVALVRIFVALPIVLYGQFESADRQMPGLVSPAIQDRSSLIADARAPSLNTIDPTH